MNEELSQIYEDDIKDRKVENEKDLDQRDKDRRARVAALLEKGDLTEAVDYHHAALIFQHGETPDDYKRAHDLAAKAVEMGDGTAKWLYASTLDRWLVSIGKPQKFGTQFRRNEQGEWEMVLPIDPDVTDKERAKYNVPMLIDALRAYKEKLGSA
jgi:hypothetical protein